MKKSAFPAALLLLGVALSGCPVYDASDSACYSDFDCADGSVCDGPTGTCVAAGQPTSPGACQQPKDCGTNETCSRSGTCMAGDCHFSSVGCVRGYECSSASGRWECVKQGTTSGGSNAGGAASAGAPAVNGGEPNMTNGGAPETRSSAGAGG